MDLLTIVKAAWDSGGRSEWMWRRTDAGNPRVTGSFGTWGWLQSCWSVVEMLQATGVYGGGGGS